MSFIELRQFLIDEGKVTIAPPTFDDLSAATVVH